MTNFLPIDKISPFGRCRIHSGGNIGSDGNGVMDGSERLPGNIGSDVNGALTGIEVRVLDASDGLQGSGGSSSKCGKKVAISQVLSLIHI